MLVPSVGQININHHHHWTRITAVRGRANVGPTCIAACVEDDGHGGHCNPGADVSNCFCATENDFSCAVPRSCNNGTDVNDCWCGTEDDGQRSPAMVRHDPVPAADKGHTRSTCGTVSPRRLPSSLPPSLPSYLVLCARGGRTFGTAPLEEPERAVGVTTARACRSLRQGGLTRQQKRRFCLRVEICWWPT